MESKIYQIAFVFVLICIMKSSDGAKILAIFPIPFKEHQAVYRPLIKNLHDSGHHLTMMTTNPYFTTQTSFENITEIDLSFVYKSDILNELRDGDLEGSEMLKTVFNVMRKIFEAELMSPKVQELLNSEKYFDLVLVEWSGSSSLMNIFAHKFKAPLVAITNGEAFPNIHEAFGNPNHPISYPSVFLPFSENLNLLQRISSVLFTVWYRFYYYTEEIPLQNEIIKSVLNGDENAPDMLDIENNADLLLINSYEILNNIRPKVPTTVYLGGIHQKQGNRDLSPSLKQFLDASERAIYVNLNYGIHQYQPRLQKLLALFEESDFDIIWNRNEDELLNTTANIYQRPDLDQESILAHSKVILHITDGGQRNIEDSIHYGVPILGISYTSTLDHYLYQMEKFDSGIVSYIDFDNQQEISEKFKEITGSNRFKTNMLKLKNMIRDQPISTSIERATWWIEYVIRNGGTKHLRNEHKNMSWVKYLMLDVLLAVIIGFASVLLTFVYIIEKIRRYSKSLPFERVTRGSKCKVL